MHNHYHAEFRGVVIRLQRLVVVTAHHLGMPEEPEKQNNGIATCLVADFLFILECDRCWPNAEDSD
jgi:hypothetical protein